MGRTSTVLGAAIARELVQAGLIQEANQRQRRLTSLQQQRLKSVGKPCDLHAGAGDAARLKPCRQCLM